MDKLISNVTAVTLNEQLDVLFGVCIGIEGGKIVYIGKNPPQEQPKTIIDGTGMVAIPGLVNCHTQLASSVLRNLLDDEQKGEALSAKLYKEDRLDERSAKAAALLSIAECLRFGVTSVSDLYYHPEATAQAVKESGIKANLALSSYRYISDTEDFDFETDEQCKELCRLYDTWHGFDNGRIKIDGGLQAVYTSNHQLWEGIADFCREKGLGVQLPLSKTQAEVEDSEDRTGLTPGQLLSCHRFFDVPAVAVGCAALTEEEQKLLGKKNVSAVVTPIASRKSGEPTADVKALVKGGMNVALGTGGAVDCGNLDLFEVIRETVLCARALEEDPAALPAPAALMMATVCGARA